MRKLKKWLGRLLPALNPRHRHSQRSALETRKSTAGATWPQGVASATKKLLRLKLNQGSSHAGGSGKGGVIQKGMMETSSFNKIKEDTFDPLGINAMIQVNIEEAKMERIHVVPRTQRRRSRRVSVAGLPTRHKFSQRKRCKTFTFRKKKKPVERKRKQSAQNIEKLQTQVDGLVETVADCSVKLLANRQSELEHCERMADRILNASSHFKRVSSKGSRRHRWRNACLLCTCCC